MCRSIKRLRDGADVATTDEIREAALQYVRKVSGFREPSARQRDAFDAAVDEVAATSARLLDQVTQRLGSTPGSAA
jgi:hypothetical protein